LGLMQMISFIEEEFDVAIDDAEVTASNFRTVADIERLVEQKAKVA
jgi:acyl carrier protein